MALLNDPNRRIAVLVSTAKAHFPETELTKLDRRRLEDWIDQLRDAEANIHRLRLRIEGMQLLENGRHCVCCGGILVAGNDQRRCPGCEATSMPRSA